MKTPILETERLLLRPLQVTDAQEVFENWVSDPDVARYMIYCTHESVETTKAWLSDVEKNLESDEYDWGFVRKSDGKLIGSCGIYYSEKFDAYTLGYNLMKDCWHQGYTTEAAKAMIDFSKEILGVHKFTSHHAEANPNSGKVMIKVGFHYVCDDDFTKMDGTHYVSKRYELIV